MHIYCVFCQTQKAAKVARFLEVVQKDICRTRCISPKIVQRCWVRGKEELREHNYLPGYLFLYTEKPVSRFDQLRSVEGVLRILGRQEDGYELKGSDRSFAQMIYDMGGTIGILKTVQVGDQVRLDADLYSGFTGEVIKLDRRKGRAKIRFEFDGNIQTSWVGYEMIRKPDREVTEQVCQASAPERTDPPYQA